MTLLVSLNFCILALLQPVSAATQAFVVPWDTVKFGPDGPWQAVLITLGGDRSGEFLDSQNTTTISVYPGGQWSSESFTKAACDEYPNSLCGAGGTWDPDPAQLESQRIQYRGGWAVGAAGIKVTDIQIVALGLTIGDKTVWNASLGVCRTGNITYPNGEVGGVPLGHLALGAGDTTTGYTAQHFTLGDNRDNAIYAPIFAGKLYDDKDIPSYSYGLHIGSAAFDYPGSLAFGGYNKGRVIGPVTPFRNETALVLLDIGIGVEYGASPFTFDNKDKLLSTGQTNATVDPLAPYLSLPSEVCENIAKLLPVTYDQSLKYYLWNIDDPLYTKIVSSPAYLSFAFPPSPGRSDNVVIKVPFALLNLTLEPPITTSPKQYFPCVPHEGGTVLGRAFLQAAFLGRNWKSATSWLAQAPGPGIARQGIGEQYIAIEDSATIIEGFEGQNYFNQSWNEHWTIITNQATNGTNETHSDDNNNIPTSKGLSSGAKAGISVGAAVGAIALLGMLAFFWRRRSEKNSQVEGMGTSSRSTPHTYDNKSFPLSQYIRNRENTNMQHPELPGIVSVQPVELPDTNSRHAQH